jgi:pimeloyl-ACP methyl ester carboxylesterase
MIGFGFSDKPDWFNYTIHAQADLAEALLAHLNVKQFHFLTHDFGDTVGQELVARHRDRNDEVRIASWLILNGGVFPELHRPRLIQKLLLNEWTGKLVQKFLSLSTFKRSFSEIFGPITQPTEEEYRDFFGLILLNGGKDINYKLIHYITDRQKHGERWVRCDFSACVTPGDVLIRPCRFRHYWKLLSRLSS